MTDLGPVQPTLVRVVSVIPLQRHSIFVNTGNATLEGLITQLKLSSKEYSVALVRPMVDFP